VNTPDLGLIGKPPNLITVSWELSMKPIALLITLILAGAARAEAPQKTTSLSSPDDFVILSDVAAPEPAIMLMYPGTQDGLQKDKCGIVIRAHPFSKADDLNSALEIAGDRGQIEDGRLVARVHVPDLVADIFTIKTRSGRNLDAVIAGLDGFTKVEAIVAVLSCR
jgi:hypothetical protein